MLLTERYIRRFCLLLILIGMIILSIEIPVYSDSSDPSQHYIYQAKKMIDSKSYRNVLFTIEMAHLSNPFAQEPFELLEQLPHFGVMTNNFESYYRQAKKFYSNQNYQSAFFYFRIAEYIDPDHGKTLTYIQRIERGSFAEKKSKPRKSTHLRIIEERMFPKISKKRVAPKRVNKRVKAKPIVIRKKMASTPKEVQMSVRVLSDQQTLVDKESIQKEASSIKTFQKEFIVLKGQVFELDDQAWALQPNTEIELETTQSIIFSGDHIKRYLAIQERVFDIERMDDNQIKLTADLRGKTFFHLWDNRGRWTFYLSSVIPLSKRERGINLKRQDEVYEQPFKFEYSNSWFQFYSGENIPAMKRFALSFNQTLGLHGPTPYGYFSGNMGLLKRQDKTELGQRSISLEDGKFGPFKDFTIRGLDFAIYLSPFTLPGRFMEGGLFESFAFNRNLKYIYFRGEDQASVGIATSGVTSQDDSFIEGVKIHLFPDQDHQYQFNYVRSFGDGKPVDRVDQVYSIQTRNQFTDFLFSSELAYDEDVFSGFFNTFYDQKKYSMKMNFYNVSDEFTTILGRAFHGGEIGGDFVWDWKPENFILRVKTDIFRDRENFRPDKRQRINYRTNINFSLPISDTLGYNSSFFYSDFSQLISPSRSLSINNGISKIFHVFHKHNINTFFRHSFQRNRFDLSRSSESDRQSISTGFRMSLIKDIDYFLNYSFSWVEAKETGSFSRPSVLNTGISYRKRFSKTLRGEMSLSYRDEENTDDQFSFLSGTDIMRGTIGLNFQPTPKTSIFFSGTVRNVWAEEEGQLAFNDASLQLGARVSWDTLFRWNPKGRILGIVYKDLNGNGEKDDEEPGISDIHVKVGKQVVLTDSEGYYVALVKAKQVNVVIDFDSVPEGFQLITPHIQRIQIEHLKTSLVDFGFLTGARLSATFFVDRNKNGFYDIEEKTVANVKLILDEDSSAYSDVDGVLRIFDLEPGSHTVQLDMSSLPVKYLPLIKIKQDIMLIEGQHYTLNFPLEDTGE